MVASSKLRRAFRLELINQEMAGVGSSGNLSVEARML
jgi:hypothetical protein